MGYDLLGIGGDLRQCGAFPRLVRGECRPEPDHKSGQSSPSERYQFSRRPLRETQNILLVEPVIPIKITSEWNLITRWITPVVSELRLAPGTIIWGFGPQNARAQGFYNGVTAPATGIRNVGTWTV